MYPPTFKSFSIPTPPAKYAPPTLRCSGDPKIFPGSYVYSKGLLTFAEAVSIVAETYN
jgi:hypothetical protein